MACLLIFFLLLGSRTFLYASPWGVVDSYMQESPDYTKIISSNHTNFAMYHFVAGKAIPFSITFDKYENQTPQTDAQWEQRLLPLIEHAFAAWPAQTRTFIQSKGRAAEFRDIDSLLNSSVHLRRVPNQEADISFDFENFKGAAFTYDVNDLSIQKHIRLPNPAFYGKKEEKNLPNFLLHEIGHYYGLGDRYQEGISGNSPTYSTTGDTDGDTIMASNLGNKLLCDDVDGFINLLDLTLFLMKGKWSARADTGWKSLCNNTKMYVQGREQNRAAFFDGTFIYYYNKDGSVKSKERARVSGNYNPFTSAQAAKGPFKQVQTFEDDDFSMKTHINYARIGEGKIAGSTHTANLQMATFTGSRKQPRKWDLSLSYERDSTGAREKTPQKQHFEINVPKQDICQLKSEYYSIDAKNISAEINLATGKITATAQGEKEGKTLKIRTEGKLENEKYTFSQGEKRCTSQWKNNELYADDAQSAEYS